MSQQTRQQFLKTLGWATVAGLAAPAYTTRLTAAGMVELHVAPGGDDRNAGTAEAPFATIERGQQAVRQRPKGTGATVWLHAGVYRLKRPLEFTPADSGTSDAPVTYAAIDSERVEISGAQLLRLNWVQAANGRWRANIPAGMDFDQLFADGSKMTRARYPNFDAGEGLFGGMSRDATNPERLRCYADPAGMYVHGYHGLGWGSLHFQILQKSPDGNYTFEAGKDPRVAGGWQNKGRARIAEASFSPDQRFVEDVFEELDAPKEWFLDRKSSTLWFIPPPAADPRRMTFEAVTLKHLIEVRGSQSDSVHNLTFRGLSFRRAGYTFMQTESVPSGGDWRIYRGGAMVCEDAVDCAVRDCVFDGVGGNAIFVKNYNRGVEITGCEFARTGASAVLFEGDPEAMRSRWAHAWGWPASEIGPRPEAPNLPDERFFMALLPPAMLKDAANNPLIDLKPGPKNDNYPAHCLVRDCLMHDLGTVEKQIAGVFISKSRNIVISHVTIHDVPRAAININDGMWGGNVVEWCDIFNNCLESREHGAINVWGRDRYWLRLAREGTVTREQYGWMRDMSRLDAVEVNTLRNNRVQCAAGYDIDLDDGSSHFDIYENLCLQGGIKLREGFFRTVRNNIAPRFSPHVWFPESGDVVTNNVFTAGDAYSPRGMKMDSCKDAWLDFNLFATYVPPEDLRRLGLDRHSLTADPQFVNPAAGDYRVRPGSPAETIGFKNFPMDRFGVVSPLLKTRAKTWSGLGNALKVTAKQAGDTGLYQWLGATLRNLTNLGRESAVAGGMELADNRGVLIKAVAPGSVAARLRIPADAVIVAANDRAVSNMADLSAILRVVKTGTIRLKILTVRGYVEIPVEAGQELPKIQ